MLPLSQLSFGFNCWQSSGFRKRFLSKATPCVPHSKNQNHFCHTDYQLHKSCDSQTWYTFFCSNSYRFYTCTFRFAIASMRSMVFECLDNFLCFSFSSQTKTLWKHSVLFSSVGLPRTVCVFVNLNLENILQPCVPRKTVAKYYPNCLLHITVAQKCHGNLNLLTAISILLTAISICSRQFQFAHGNFNLFTVISICSRQFQFTQTRQRSRQRSRHLSLRSPPVNFGGRQWPPKAKTQNQKSLFKVDLQSEKWKSKTESRFTNTYASRQWIDNRRVYWSQKIMSFI